MKVRTESKLDRSRQLIALQTYAQAACAGGAR